MAFYGMNEYIMALEEAGQLKRIRTYTDPVLEIAEIADRVGKSGGPALLFENTGTQFPILVNMFGSDARMSKALGRSCLDEAGKELEMLFRKLASTRTGSLSRIMALGDIRRISNLLPRKTGRKGTCQQVIMGNPDLDILPVLKCWPYDGGRFITLPVVHTRHPETGNTNAGMYRMQVIDKVTTGMHWQLHKTGANHFEAWKKKGGRMPVSVSLGGDPVYTYAATAPLPENIDEYILAGFLRKKRVRMVKCITNDLFVPDDADIVIEGFVETDEDLVWEGPFGDHTGFYSLADWYPAFHITCITHRKDAVYPATIVGVPPQEDSFIAKATERIFLPAIRMSMLPEIKDLHMPDPGVAHNLVIVKIGKKYSGQGMKVINSLMGAGQMMFTKYMIVVSGNTDIRNYEDLARGIFLNTDFRHDISFIRGPLDVLDHSSDTFAFGGKLGMDATEKTSEELSSRGNGKTADMADIVPELDRLMQKGLINGYNCDLAEKNIPLILLTVDPENNPDAAIKIAEMWKINKIDTGQTVILVLDDKLDLSDFLTVAWQVLGNSDPLRDHYFAGTATLLIDGTIKAFRDGGFTRKWPNVVCSDNQTIKSIDRKWELLGLGDFISSPSMRMLKLKYEGTDEVVTKGDK